METMRKIDPFVKLKNTSIALLRRINLPAAVLTALICQLPQAEMTARLHFLTPLYIGEDGGRYSLTVIGTVFDS